MASNNGPYYATNPGALQSLDNGHVRPENPNFYLDPSLSIANDAQMYARSATQLEGLLDAATALQDEPYGSGSPSQSRGATRKSKRVSRKNPAPSREENNLNRSRLGNENGRNADPLPGSALFRQPSETTKKSTRPAVLKVFNSLELPIPIYAQLKTAAREYMLNDAFPDRRDTVGRRGETDTEFVRLKLWTCVNSFLDAEGYGDRFFGLHIPGPDGVQRTMFWPADKETIIASMIPLMRRMVTNERQRTYTAKVRQVEKATGKRKTRKSIADRQDPSTQDRSMRSDATFSSRNMEVGMNGLFSDMSGSDLGSYDAWRSHGTDTFSKITPLLTETGLSDSEINGLVATMDYHLRVSHSNAIENGECDVTCEEDMINRMLESGHLDHGSWHCDVRSDNYEKRDSARPILHKVFRLIKESLSSYPNHSVVAKGGSDSRSVNAEDRIAKKRRTDGDFSFTVFNEDSLVLHFNLLEGGKRALPCQKIDAGQCATLESALLPFRDDRGSINLQDVEVMVFLPNGLVRVSNDAEWLNAIAVARSTDWMDNEVKVLINVL